MSRILACLLLAGSLLPSLARADAIDDIRGRGSVRVGVKIDYPPFGYLADGEILGIEPQLAENLAEILQVNLELIPVTAANRFQLLTEGAVDLLLATVSDTNDRRYEVQIVDPDYYASGTNILAPDVAGLRYWGDLQGRLVCAVEGAFYNARVQDEFGAELLLFESTAEMMQSLREGACLGAVYDAAFIISELLYGDWEGYSMPLQTIDTEYWGVAVAPGEDALGCLISGAITRWHLSGLILELLADYDVPANPLAEELYDYFRGINPNIVR